MSGPVPCWLAVLNWVVRFSVMAWTSTLTPFSVAHCLGERLDRGRALVVGPDRRGVAAPAAADAPSDGAAPDAASDGAAALAAAVLGLVVAEPPLEHAATMIAISASRTPNRLITW